MLSVRSAPCSALVSGRERAAQAGTAPCQTHREGSWQGTAWGPVEECLSGTRVAAGSRAAAGPSASPPLVSWRRADRQCGLVPAALGAV